jgi:hypothetical protein
MSIELTYLFDTSTVGTFDSDLIMFTNSSAQLKDLRPANATFYAEYSSNINGNWGDGSLTGTASGGAGVSGGYLILNQSDVRYVEYSATSNFSILTTNGCIRFGYKPNYSGSPASDMSIICISKANGDTDNLIFLRHASTGQWQVLVYSNTGVAIVNATLGVWSPTSGTTYEIELNIDVGTSATRLFIDGVQFGSTMGGIGNRDNSIGLARVGSNINAGDASNFSIDYVAVFSTPQHTANYTSGQSISATIFSTDNPTILLSTSFRHQGIDALTETINKAGSDQVKYTLTKNSTPYYHDGTGWTVSADTYAQANTALEISTNAATFDSITTVTTPKVFIHSDDGSTTPTLTSIKFEYDYAGETPSSIATCIVWGYSKDVNNTANGLTVTAELSQDVVQYKTNIMLRNLSTVSATPEALTGYWEMSLIETTNMTGTAKYIFNFNGKKYAKQVPATSTAYFWELED